MARFDGLRRERVLASPQYRDGAFRNANDVASELKGSFLPLLGEFAFGSKKRSPAQALPVENPQPTWASSVRSGLRVTWLGHSTLLLEVDGVRILTDPVFGKRASPFSFAGPKRFHPVPAEIGELPPLDAVLLSHDHHDHLCPESMRKLAKRRVPVVTSLGVGIHLERLGFEPALITELDWWEEHTLASSELRFTATPSQHFSGRGLRDRNTTLWSSWVLNTKDHQLFFSGDTGLGEQFTEIHSRFGSFDMLMLEIGAWHELWGDMHLGPENALRAYQMLGGGALLPIHWGTFDVALHPWNEPAETLIHLAEPMGARILTPRIGRPFEPNDVEHVDPWWR